MLKQKFKPILGVIQGRAAKVGIVVAVVVTAIFIVAYNFWPRTFMFAYQQQTCINKVTFLPSTVQFNSDSFEMMATDRLTIAGVDILSGALCISPTKTPEPGVHNATSSLFGRLPAGHVKIEVPSHPIASVSITKPLPVTQPL